MKKWIVPFLAFVLVIAIVAPFAWMAVGLQSSVQNNRVGASDTARESGRRAKAAGLPASANPHQGDGQDGGRRARAWLEGYMDATEGK